MLLLLKFVNHIFFAVVYCFRARLKFINDNEYVYRCVIFSVGEEIITLIRLFLFLIIISRVTRYGF